MNSYRQINSSGFSDFITFDVTETNEGYRFNIIKFFQHLRTKKVSLIETNEFIQKMDVKFFLLTLGFNPIEGMEKIVGKNIKFIQQSTEEEYNTWIDNFNYSRELKKIEDKNRIQTQFNFLFNPPVQPVELFNPIVVQVKTEERDFSLLFIYEKIREFAKKNKENNEEKNNKLSHFYKFLFHEYNFDQIPHNILLEAAKTLSRALSDRLHCYNELYLDNYRPTKEEEKVWENIRIYVPLVSQNLKEPQYQFNR